MLSIGDLVLDVTIVPDRRLQRDDDTPAVITVGGGRVVLAHTVYAQPRFDDFSDVRWLHDSTLALTVTRYLSVRFSATVTLDTRPPEGVKPLDVALKSALAVTF